MSNPLQSAILKVIIENPPLCLPTWSCHCFCESLWMRGWYSLQATTSLKQDQENDYTQQGEKNKVIEQSSSQPACADSENETWEWQTNHMLNVSLKYLLCLKKQCKKGLCQLRSPLSQSLYLIIEKRTVRTVLPIHTWLCLCARAHSATFPIMTLQRHSYKPGTA